MKLWIRIYLWFNRNHKWHKDWLGCLICDLRNKNNPDKPCDSWHKPEGDNPM